MKIKLLLTISILLVLASCNEGPMEKNGKKADEIIENVEEGKAPLHNEGANEKAGEAVDEAIDDMKK